MQQTALSLTFVIGAIVWLLVYGPPKNNLPLRCVIYVSIALNIYVVARSLLP